MHKIKLGVIGASSKIALEYHLPALARCDGIILESACDLNIDRLNEVKSQFGFNKITTDYSELLADDEIDAVAILTKVDLHAEIAIAAAKAKKHIFMQKAISRSLDEAQAIIDAARENGIKLTISYMHRYFDECRKAAEIIKDNTLGDIQYARMRNSAKNSEISAKSYGGSIMDIGGHGIDLVRSLFKQEIINVKTLFNDGEKMGESGWFSNLNGDEIYAVLLYELENHTKVIHEIVWSHISKSNRFEVEIFGRKGSLYIRNPFIDNKLLLGIAENGVENGIVWSMPEHEETFFGQYQHQLFIDDLRFGREDSLTGEDGFKALSIVEAARRSIESEQWETPLSVK